MMGFLSKFVLQMLPTISATVIGAYIVATWVNPKTPPDAARIAAQSRQVATASSAAPEQEAAEAKPADAAETARPVKPSGPETIRIIPIVKERPSAADVSTGAPLASVSASQTVMAVDDRRDANELARVAIQRLRSGAETERAAEEPAKPVAAPVRAQQARAVEPQQPSVATVVPPLPPAVSIAGPRYAQADTLDLTAPGNSQRLTPPGEIPVVRAPLSLHASHRVVENPSLADEFLTATKSFFRAITPQ